MNLVTIIIMVAAGLVGLLGLTAASSAVDDAMYLFGLIMFGFALVVNFCLLKRHFDQVDAQRSP
jgi:hypothetical protein